MYGIQPELCEIHMFLLSLVRKVKLVTRPQIAWAAKTKTQNTQERGMVDW